MDKEEILQKLFSPKRHNLPSLPVLFVELKKMLDSPFTSSQKMADLIKKDQGLVAKIMQLSNSVLYGKRQDIKRFDSAITYLGTNALRNLVLQLCLVRMFSFNSNILPEFSPAIFWKHSLATAYFSEQLAMMLRLPKAEDYYLGGLLHDLGKVLLFQFHPQEFEKTVLIQIEQSISGVEAEIQAMGIDHTDIGSFLAESWKFDPVILKVIANHHKLLPSKMNLATAVVSLANDFANMSGLGLPWDTTQFFDIANLNSWQWIQKNQDMVGVEPDSLLFELSQNVNDIAHSVDIMLAKPGEKHA